MIRKSMLTMLLASSAPVCAATPVAADPAIADAATNAADDPVQSDEVVVTGTKNEGYRAVDTGALGVDLSLKELPATVNVITDQFIKDTGAHRISDIIAYTPGVVNNEKATSVAEYFIVRGFATSLTYLDGVRQTAVLGRRGLATIDRIEVVKGPAGAEAGIADPGGTINILTKRPQATFSGSIDGGFGDFHYRNITGDVTGPIALDGKLQARLIGGYEQSVVYRPGQPKHQPFVTLAPSLKLDYAPGGSIYAQYEHNRSHEYFDRGVLHLEGYYPSGFGPRDSSSVNSELDYQLSKNQRFEAGLDQKLGPFTLTLRHFRSRDRITSKQMDAEPPSSDLYKPFDPNASLEQQARDSYTWNGTGYTIPFFYSVYSPYVGRAQNYSAALKADFTVFGVSNTVVGGYDYTRNVSGGPGVFPSVTNVLDIRNPDNNQTPNFVGPVGRNDQNGTEKIHSYYLKWVARPSTRLRLVAAGRWDRYFTAFTYTYDDGLGNLDSGGSTLKDKLFSYRAAGSFDLTGAATAFVGYSDAYIPQGGFTRTVPVPALRARSLEAGVKVSFANGNALWTNTVYSIRQDNLTIDDPTNIIPAESFVVLFGAVRARGFETELTGRPLPGLELSTGLSVLQTKVVENNGGYLGKRFLNVPNFQASAFASYNLKALGIDPLTVRLGFNALGNRQGNPENTFKLPGYVRIDGGAAYKVTDKLELGVAIENLLDKTYYVAADQGGLGGNTVSVGNRRLVQATLGYKF